MSETLRRSEEEMGHPWKSELFSSYWNGSEGEAWDSYIEATGVDEAVRHADWPTAHTAQRRLHEELKGVIVTPLAVSCYGYSVYRDLLLEEGYDVVYLDTRMFLAQIDLVDVLAEAINCAVDEGTSELSSILLLSMIRTAGPENFTDQRMRKYLDTIISTGNSETIRKYVDFMNANTVKGPDDSKEFLKRMAHAVLGMPLKARDNPTGIDRGERQVLLEDIGHAWIRKSMPTAEINWLE